MKALRILFLAITLVVVYYVSRDLVYPCMATLNYDFFIDHGWMNMRPGLDIQGPETFAAHLGIWAPTITLWITALLLIASCVVVHILKAFNKFGFALGIFVPFHRKDRVD